MELNQKQVRTLAVVLVIHVILLMLTRRDLRSRPDSAVRGNKRLWKTWSTMNTTGSVAYWLIGRKSVADNGVEVASA
jgi:ABC-type Fe3+ transport system permease subunit